MPLWFAHPPPTTNHQPPPTMPSFLLPLAALVSAGAGPPMIFGNRAAATIGWEKVVHHRHDPVFPRRESTTWFSLGSPRFSRRIRGVTPVCNDRQCQLVEATAVWDPPGYFATTFAGQAAHQEGPSAVTADDSPVSSDFEGSPVDSELVAQVPAARAAGRGYACERRDAVTAPTPLAVQEVVRTPRSTTCPALGQRRNGPAARGVLRNSPRPRRIFACSSPPRCDVDFATIA